MLSLVAASRPARADLLFFKDGFAIEGRVKREMTLEFDKVGREAYHMPKGFFFLDDGPRRVFFSPSQVRFILEKDPPSEERILCKNPIYGQGNPKRFPGLLEVMSAPEWNPQWSRRFEFRSMNGNREDVPQHIGMLTPYWARVDSMGKYFWSCAYLTRELGQETVQSLLAMHPDFQEKEKQKPEQLASMRLRKADFFAQAGWLDLAEKELDRLVEKMPDRKERVEAARKTLFKLRASERLEEIKRRHRGGQHRQVRKLLADFPTKGVPERQIAELEELKAEYENTDRLLKDTARLLEQTRRAMRSDDRKWLDEAAGAISDNLNFENVMRLDAFLGQARQAERLRKKGQQAEVSAEQLLSLAVSGWLLGSASAEMSVETARRLWHGREMVLSYLNSDDDKRKQILKRHLMGSRTESASLDELLQIIRTLPPIAAEKKLPNGAATFKTAEGTYHVQLPPEYRHGRPYPVLLVLHQAGEKPQAMLNRWAEPAAEHGYILVAPEWQGGLNNRYNYSAAEHAIVLSTLKDLRQRFNADEDRVFLFGLGEGGAMAFDVGLGHPDLFAGVLPMGAAPQFHAEICWRNGQYLPFYVVNGNQCPNADKVREQFNNWILRHFPMLWIDYKGRGVEWYAGEVPNMFDWMRGKRRLFPLRQLGSDGRGGGFGNEFCTLRPGDNHFYWLSSDDVRNTKTLDDWIARLRLPPASLTARIDRDDNKIYLNSSGIGQVTIWLGRDSKGENMIDFDRRLTVQHGFSIMRVPPKVTPSLEVLMEDFAQRGDRQQLFFAKIPLQLLPPKRR
jgi:pimeloyl-ACP methyl ester carboxylesterase